jgi:hypothetical protein
VGCGECDVEFEAPVLDATRSTYLDFSPETSAKQQLACVIFNTMERILTHDGGNVGARQCGVVVAVTKS